MSLKISEARPSESQLTKYNLPIMITKRLSVFHFPTLIFLLFASSIIAGVESRNNSRSALIPSRKREYYSEMIRPSDTGGGPFQLCLLCRCCMVESPDDCSSMSCCFGIECDLPDKPYGVCAFVPQSCNCTSCV